MTHYRRRLEEIYVYLDLKEGSVSLTPFDWAAYDGKIPAAMLDFWREKGIGSVLDGDFQFVEPKKYHSIVEGIFHGDEQLTPHDTAVLAVSCFGNLIAWHKEHQAIEIDLIRGQVICDRLSDHDVYDDDVVLTSALLGLDGQSYDEFDTDGKPLFQRAKKRLGPLPHNSIYGFLPILAFGGSRKLESLKIYDALAHMTILAQAQELTLMDFDPYPPVPVRPIGG